MDSRKLSTCVLGKHHHHHRHHHHPSKYAITCLYWTTTVKMPQPGQNRADAGSISPVLARLRHFYRDHHHHYHHHHHHYLRKDQKILKTTKILILTKGFKRIECGCFFRDNAGFHEHNEPRVVLYKLWHDTINSHKVTKHACTFSWLPLATQYTTFTITLQ